jgi:hypothetical protein
MISESAHGRLLGFGQIASPSGQSESDLVPSSERVSAQWTRLYVIEIRGYAED